MLLIVFLSSRVLILRMPPPMSLLFHTFLTSPSIAHLLPIIPTLISSPPHTQVFFSVAAAVLLLTPDSLLPSSCSHLRTAAILLRTTDAWRHPSAHTRHTAAIILLATGTLLSSSCSHPAHCYIVLLTPGTPLQLSCSHLHPNLKSPLLSPLPSFCSHPAHFNISFHSIW